METGGDGPDRDAEGLGDLGTGQTDVVCEHEDGPLVETQAKERAVESVAVGDAGVVVVGFGDLDRLDGDVEARPPRPPLLISAGTDEQAVHPRIEGARIAQAPQVPPGVDERLLYGILGGIPVAEDPPRDRVQAVVGGGREGIEGLVVAPLCAFDEFG